jgi:signal transduction histidine kinase/ligand-binding sensor domain-containing protein
MFKHAIGAFCLLVTGYLNIAIGQTKLVKPSLELSTQIINDLLSDKQGFLWLATDLGVSRFDGINVVNFTSRSQSSLAADNLCEDNEGKIWFTNSTGQIFYIQNEQMHLLSAFNSEKQSTLPQIGLANNQLFATTDLGLFVLNTTTLKGKYFKTATRISSMRRSLAVMTDKVLLYDNTNWFLYKKGSLKRIPADSSLLVASQEISSLFRSTTADTAFLQTNPSGIVRKIIIKNDSVKVVQSLFYRGFINTISIDGNNQWVNATNASYSLKTKQQLIGLNVSDVVTDQEGNVWISTLDKGIYVDYRKSTRTNELQIPGIDRSDLIRTIVKLENQLLFGTKKGRFIVYDPAAKKLVKRVAFDAHLGSIQTMGAAESDGLYIGFQGLSAKITTQGAVLSIAAIPNSKQFLKIGHFTFVTTLDGLFAIPDNNSDSLKSQFVRLFGTTMKYDPRQQWYHFGLQCDAITYYTDHKSLVVAFKNGLSYINSKGMFPLQYNELPVYATAVCNYNGSLYIGTANNGLLILDKRGIKNISLTQGLLSTAIVKLKLINHHLWIVAPGSLQLLDLQSLRFINQFDLPSRKEVQVTDVEESNNTAFLTTLAGLITYPLDKFAVKKGPRNYLLGIRVNEYYVKNNDTIPFAYSQNNISFRIGVPTFHYAKDIYIKYCLSTGTDTTWQATEPGERVIYFHSLAPGKYIFKALAVDPKSGITGKVIIYHFTIQLPWWKNIWLRLFIAVFFMGLVNYFGISYYLNKIAFQQALYEEQQSIRLERQRISSEIHDDIGSGLFAIQLFAEITSKKRPDIMELAEISSMVEGISQKIREIIWSTNIENDNLENLIYYIQFQITKMFEHTPIKFQSSIPNEILDADINTQIRRDIYLIIKEISYNSVKHSQALNASLIIKIVNNLLIITIKDDGIGFSPDQVKIDSMGMDNIQSRIKRLKGILAIDHENGTTITVMLPIKKILTKSFINTLKEWQIQLFTLFRKSHMN